MMRTSLFGLVVAVSILSACGEREVRMDASSDEAMQKSIQQIEAQLTEDKRADFRQALMTLAGAHMADAFSSAFNPKQPAGVDLAAKLRAEFQGKTATEIIRLAKQQRADAYARQLKSLDGEITALNQEIMAEAALADSAKERLEKVIIKGARFYFTKSMFRAEPTIDFHITNGTDIAIKKLFFRGVLESVGRTIPWVDKGLNYEVRGGLEPGETQHLKLAPNMFSDWGDQDLQNRKDLTLTLTLENFENAAGERLLSVSQEELRTKRARLADLQKQRQTLGAKHKALN